MLRRFSRLCRDASKPSHKLRDQCVSDVRSYSQHSSSVQLRILFCGSDDFSIASLNALHRYSQESGSIVASIDVAAKTDKRVGRGLKIVRPPPIKPFAQSLGLPIHQFDTFRGWSLPTATDGSSYINMIIAVSFGLLVPPRILGSCQYGGLNVHPSMLPDLKGSAPIEHTIMNGYRKTGVTVQTLHPSKFDEGEIVLQTSEPGLDIPQLDSITSSELRDFLAPVGAEMLVECLRNQRYLQPSPPREPSDQDGLFKHAPKLSPESRHIVFQKMTLTHILRLNRALGRLWTYATTHGEQNDTRFIYGSNMKEAESDQIRDLPTVLLEKLPIGLPFNTIHLAEKLEESNLPLLVKTSDSKLLSFSEITVSGMKPGPALASAAKAGMIEEAGTFSQQKAYIFKKALG